MREEYNLFQVRGTEHAIPVEERPLTVVCFITNNKNNECSLICYRELNWNCNPFVGNNS